MLLTTVKVGIKKVEEIRDEADYPGFRVSIDAILENAKIPIKVDITTGDEITPKEILHMYQKQILEQYQQQLINQIILLLGQYLNLQVEKQQLFNIN